MLWGLVVLGACVECLVGSEPGSPRAVPESKPDGISSGELVERYAYTGNWFEFAYTLEDHGLVGHEWKANFLWNVDGGLQQRFGYDDEWKP